MFVSLTLKSNGTEGKDWRLIYTKPSEKLILPANGEIPYQFKVQFLKSGNFFLQTKASIFEVLNSTATGLPITYQSQGSTIKVVQNAIFPVRLEEPQIVTEYSTPLVCFPRIGFELIVQSELKNKVPNDIQITVRV